MRRRQFAAAATGALAGLAGCSGLLDSDEGSSGEGPAEVTRAFFEAAARGDVEEVNDRIHPETDQDTVQQDDLEDFQAGNAAVEETEVLNRSGDVASVRVALSADNPMTGDRQTVENTVELRRHEGEWLVYGAGSSGGTSQAVPQVAWDLSETTNDDGLVTAVSFTHGGGDTVVATDLGARAAGQAADPPAGADALQAGDVLSVPFEGAGDGVAAGAAVEIVWNGDGGPATTIGRYTLTADTAGGLADQFEV